MRREEHTRCSKCDNRRTVFFRRYSGEQLCRRCFIESIEEKVRKTISKYKMFDRNDTIGVGLSGGKDSLTLLHVLNRIENYFPNSRTIAFTIDEGIKGYRQEAIEISTEYCKKMGIEHVVSSFKDLYGYDLDSIVKARSEKKGISTCAFCGILRRRALNLLARDYGVDKLATAHNLDDETQTILLNMTQGDVERLLRTQPKLKGIHTKFVQRVKPLCEIPEREIALYAYLKKIRFQEAVCPYRESSMRQEIREIIEKLEKEHPGIKYKIVRVVEKLRSKLKEDTVLEIQECTNCGEPASSNLCKVCTELTELKTDIVSRSLY